VFKAENEGGGEGREEKYENRKGKKTGNCEKEERQKKLRVV
jgi:hypothetical protein